MNEQMNEVCLGLGCSQGANTWCESKEALRICETEIWVEKGIPGTGMHKGWRSGRVGCVRETVASSAAGAEVECAGHATDDSGDGTVTAGLWEAWLCPVYSWVGHNECFRCHEEGRQCQAMGGPGRRWWGCDPEQARGQRAGTKLRESDLVLEEVWRWQGGDSVWSGLGCWVNGEVLHSPRWQPGEEQVWEQEHEFSFAFKIRPEKCPLEGSIRFGELFEVPIQSRAGSRVSDPSVLRSDQLLRADC